MSSKDLTDILKTSWLISLCFRLSMDQLAGDISHGSQGDSSGRSTPNSDSAPGKLFVGGLSWQTNQDKLREYFGQFGNVTDVLVMKDPITQVSEREGDLRCVLTVPVSVKRRERKTLAIWSSLRRNSDWDRRELKEPFPEEEIVVEGREGWWVLNCDKPTEESSRCKTEIYISPCSTEVAWSRTLPVQLYPSPRFSENLISSSSSHQQQVKQKIGFNVNLKPFSYNSLPDTLGHFGVYINGG